MQSTARATRPPAAAPIERSPAVAPYRAALYEPSSAGALFAAIAAGVLSMFHPIHALLIVWLVVFQGLDLVLGSHAARKRRRFCPDREARGIRDKMIRDAQIVIAIGIDMVAVQAGAWNEAILTAGVLAWLMYEEGKSVLRHIRVVQGKDAVWGGFDQVEGRLEQHLGKRPAAAAPKPDGDR